MKALIWTWFTGSWKCFQKNHLRQRFKETVRPDMFVPATQLFPFALLLPHRSELSYLKYIKTRCQLHTDGIRTKMLWCYDQNSADLRLRSFTTYSCMFFPQLVLHHVRSFSDYYDQFIEVHAKRLFVLWMLSLLLHLAQKIYHEEHAMTCYDMLWHAMTCYDMLWHAMTCYDMLWHAMTCYDPCQAQCGNMWKTLKPWPWHGNIRNRNDTTAESPSAVTLLCCRVLLVLLVHLVFLRLLGILRVLCVLLGVLRATQSRSDILIFLCTARLHSLVVYVIVSYCLILFHIVSFCFQVKLQIGRNNQNQNISKQSLWQRRLQKRCPGSSLVSSTGGGSSKSGLWESWSVWKKKSA